MSRRRTPRAFIVGVIVAVPLSINLADIAFGVPDRAPLYTALNLSFGPVRTGIVGRNGVGKTTLLKVIAGELAPRAGRVTINGRMAVLRQDVQAHPEATIADLFGARAALEVLRRAERGVATVEELADAEWTLEARIAAALGRLGLEVPVERRLVTLSDGERTRAGLAALVFDEPDFLLLDEPTNNLDRAGRDAVINLLEGWRSGALVVSHDRALLESMDAIVELTTLGATRYGGNWSSYRAQKAHELAAVERELADAEKRLDAVARSAQATLERQSRRNRTGRRDSAGGGTPRIVLGRKKDQSESTGGAQARLADRRREEANDARMAARERVEVLTPVTVRLPPTGLAAGKAVLRIDRVTAGYVTDRPVLREFSLAVTGPERVAIRGPNGSGKSTVLALVTGSMRPWSGSVEVGATFAMLDQRVTVLDSRRSVRENFLRLNPESNENTCRAALARFAFRAESAEQIVGTLSGGELLRAGLACVLGGNMPPALLILDEPTNHLDIDSIEAVERGIVAFDGALLVVSHDQRFLDAIGITRTVELPSRG